MLFLVLGILGYGRCGRSVDEALLDESCGVGGGERPVVFLGLTAHVAAAAPQRAVDARELAVADIAAEDIANLADEVDARAVHKCHIHSVFLAELGAAEPHLVLVGVARDVDSELEGYRRLEHRDVVFEVEVEVVVALHAETVAVDVEDEGV